MMIFFLGSGLNSFLLTYLPSIASFPSSSGVHVLSRLLAASVKVQLWLRIAAIFRQQRRFEEAKKCIAAARAEKPCCRDVEYAAGRLSEAQDDLPLAMSYFQQACVIDPMHERSVRALGIAQYKQGLLDLAEGTLVNAIALDRRSHKAWRALGAVFQDSNPVRAVDCLFTALDLEATSPLDDFATLPWIF